MNIGKYYFVLCHVCAVSSVSSAEYRTEANQYEFSIFMVGDGEPYTVGFETEEIAFKVRNILVKALGKLRYE